MSTPVTVHQKIRLLHKEAEEKLTDALKANSKELNDDHTLVLDTLLLAPDICRPLVLACELMNNRHESGSLRAAATKLAQCFPDKIPDGQEQVSFDIPAYIVEEFKQALKQK
jgi:hypothetical protein